MKNLVENYNYLNKAEFDTIWVPRLIFNDAIIETILMVDEFASIVVKYVGGGKPNPSEQGPVLQNFTSFVNKLQLLSLASFPD